MSFDVVTLSDGVYHLQSGANSGLLTHDGQAIVIDTGLDDDAGRRIRRALEERKLTLAAVILTHGHADHFGGTAYLRRNLPPFTVYAPAIERAFIEYAGLEGYMLSGGATPLDTLQGKFTRAPACTVDHTLDIGRQTIAGMDLDITSLAGHSPNQIGVLARGVLFSADAFLPVETLQKYPVPFTASITQALATLERLRDLRDVWFAPGHGIHLSDAQAVIEANHAALSLIVETVAACLRTASMNEADLTQLVCRLLGDGLTSAVGYYLARATIQAALVHLSEQRRIEMTTGGKLIWTHAP